MNAGSTTPESESGRTDLRLSALEARLDAILPTLATKADLANLRTEFREGLANLRAELREDMAALRAEFKEGLAALRADMLFEMGKLRDEQHKASEKLLKWVVSTMVALVIACLGTMLAIMNMAVTLSRSVPAHSARPAAPAAENYVVLRQGQAKSKRAIRQLTVDTWMG